MLEFLRESLLCSSDDSPKREASGRSGRSGSRLGLCCAGGPARTGRRRPAEVICSQGAPTTAPPAAAADTPLAWDFGKGRPSVGTSGSHSSSSSMHCRLRSSPSFQGALGNSFACSAAAFARQEDALPGRGLYVPMQRGLGTRCLAGGRPNSRRDTLCPSRVPSSRSPPASKARAASQSQPPPGPHLGSGSVQLRFPGPAANYEAAPEDPLDRAMEAHTRQLPASAARALLLRRLAPGDYEIDGRRVRVGWRGAEVVAFAPAPPGEEENCLGGESLLSFLLQAADRALARAHWNMSNGGGSFETREAGRLTTGAWAAQGSGSFVMRPGEGGSFLLNSREGSAAGSFYSVYGSAATGGGGQAAAAKDHRMEVPGWMACQEATSQRGGGPGPAPPPGGGSSVAASAAAAAAITAAAGAAAAALAMHGSHVQAPPAIALQRQASAASFYVRTAPGSGGPDRGAGSHQGQPGAATPSLPASCFALPRAHTQGSVGQPPTLVYAPQYVTVHG